MTQVKAFSGKISHAYGLTTAIDKQLITDDIIINEYGIAGDESADPKHHGGLERALHHYPREHYDFWQSHYQALGIERDWCPSSMGENISTLGLDENNVCIGDRFQWGEVILEVSQPRSPCFKLNKRWDIEKFSLHMQQTNKCGWLYRVITPGVVTSDSGIVRISQTSCSMTVAQVCDIYFGDPLNKNALTQLLDIPLSNSWRSSIEKRLASNELENWNFRLFGHP
ncbi:MOSC domain-containing protein [Psychrobium sp. MM17-31]|uniref:MOSC domain-containing protein n=1 Tax=Psychrobium sp. MM17-31 TaxID=2917758 RepID=UPI001EF74070|nr:MOSC domain-containing protein [Psychrobium sp. MM17-31]MCG7531814.1 MOSC domain-containing protein [Psychrobium sp. MM17-31]